MQKRALIIGLKNRCVLYAYHMIVVLFSEDLRFLVGCRLRLIFVNN